MLPQIDYEKVESIPYKKTVALVNDFIISTTQFLNRFSYLCEQKLSKVGRDLQRLEITMSILETKLASIPGLEDVQIAEAPPADAPIEAPPVLDAEIPLPPVDGDIPPPPGAGIPPPPGIPSAPQTGRIPAPPATSGPPAPPMTSGAPPVANGVAPGTLLNKDDPRYAKYFKYVRLGIPLPQIKSKMVADGLDPSALDNPDAPSNGGSNGASSGVPLQPPSTIPFPPASKGVPPPPASSGVPPPPLTTGRSALPAVESGPPSMGPPGVPPPIPPAPASNGAPPVFDPPPPPNVGLIGAPTTPMPQTPSLFDLPDLNSQPGAGALVPVSAMPDLPDVDGLPDVGGPEGLPDPADGDDFSSEEE